MTPGAEIEVAVGWPELPAYAARLMRAAGGHFSVIATRPTVPVAGMDELLPGRICWVDKEFAGGWRELGRQLPGVYFQPAWNSALFTRLGAEVRANGGAVVVMFDNPWKGSWRQWLGAVAFRSRWRGQFAAAWVCGAAGERLARFWGFAPKRIFSGLYGADPAIFEGAARPPLAQRPRRILFVGRLIAPKGVEELMQAWSRFVAQQDDWELHVYGSGELRDAVNGRGVVCHGFQQPDAIARAMAEARFLVLPSREEHWGLVVCEAAQAGCGLLLSAAVGSVPDLVGSGNGHVFRPGDPAQIGKALSWAVTRSATDLAAIEAESRARGGAFTPQRWANTFHRIVAQSAGKPAHPVRA